MCGIDDIVDHCGLDYVSPLANKIGSRASRVSLW